mgnify:CR=1 FL=1|tara:strand:- start:135 stop:860 length:726 start_codon:yes stop_codon:yes gene_type:complete
MVGRPKIGLQVCVCNYESSDTGNFRRHQKVCSKFKQSIVDARIASLEQELTDQKERMSEELKAKDEQLRAKDEQIKELIQVAKKPRTVVNNNKWVVEQHINVFGKESLDLVSERQIKEILRSDPASAVSQLIKLKHRSGSSNANIRCPNLKRAMYQVVAYGEDDEGEPMKQWENRAKGEVLEELYESNAGHLEAEADEDDYFGNRFLDHQDKVKASSEGEDGGRRYKEQLDRIHCVITSIH